MLKQKNQGHKAIQSQLFKSIKADSRNNHELRRMIQNLDGTNNSEKEIYHFYINNEIKEFSAKVMFSNNV